MEELYQLYLQHPNVQTDTRQLKKGAIYFALKGPNFNGNTFAAAALEAGASYVVVDEEVKVPAERAIRVNDVLTTLQQLARHHREQLKIPFLAITGSNGKTTTKELIHAVLSTTLRTSTTEGNLNNHIGVPLTILKIPADAQVAVIEMGANHMLEIAGYCRVALPTHGLITNCGKAHLEGFGSEENIKKGKGELFDFIRANKGTAFIYNDYDYLREMSRGIAPVITYGTHEALIKGEVLHTDPFLQVSVSSGISGTIQSQLVGAYNLPNILAAVAVGVHFGIHEKDIIRAIESYAPSNSRSQLVKIGTNQVILDAYNANPGSMKAAIENFAQLKSDKKILVLGAMAEMGSASSYEHETLISQIKMHQWNEVLLVGKDFNTGHHPYRIFSSADEAGEWLQKEKINNALLLVKGSRSMKMERTLNYLS